MSRFTPISTTPAPERVILMGVDRRDGAWPIQRSLDELERLADTAGAVVVARMTQKLDRPIAKSYIGSGKVEELRGLVERLDVDAVIFDDELSPSQQSHLEQAIGRNTKVIDRTALILDIFGLHARTREGRLQVQLAQLQYLLPRLRGMWTHLAKEQTRGGIGSRFGQGESQLEIDRRLIRNRISTLRKELSKLESRREVQSKWRASSCSFRVALAGYTNAGKSSLLNRLTGSDILAEDKLFATLDPTTRSYELPGGRAITVTDTVGFIQKLPHGLIEAFKSTLSEIREADLILKVVDVTDENRQQQIEAVERTLREVNAGSCPAIMVLNKVDLIGESQMRALKRRMPDALFFSARTGLGLSDLQERLVREAAAADVLISCDVPHGEGALISTVHARGQIVSELFLDEYVSMVCRVPPRVAARLERYRTE